MYRLFLVMLVLALPGCGGVAPVDPNRDPNILIEGALERRVLPAGEDTTAHARVRIGVRDPAGAQDAHANVALVVDTSGSMKGDLIVEARKAAQALVDALSDDDRLAVIAFHSKTEVLLASTPLDGDVREEAATAIAGMRAIGTTDMSGGLQAGLDQVGAYFDANGINRVVLLGDGVPNEGSALRPMAEAAGRRGISITSLGLGEDYDESVMGAIAQLSGGRFRYVESAEKVVAFLKEEALRLDGVYARNAVLELTPGPGVQIEDVIGHPLRRGSVVEVALGDMSREDEREFFVKLKVTAHRAGAPIELLDAVLRYDDPRDSSVRKERRLYFGGQAGATKAEVEAGRDRGVEAGLARAVAAAETVKAIEQARSGDSHGASTRLSAALAEARRQSERYPALAKQADAMKRLQGALESGKAPSNEAVRAATPGVAAPGAAQAAAQPPADAAHGSALEFDSDHVAPSPQLSSPAKRTIRSTHDEAMQILQ